MEEIGRSTTYEDGNFPFLRYAATSWVAHTRQCDAESVPQDDLLALFAWPSNDLVGLWARVYQKMIDRYSVDCPRKGTSLVYVVSRYGVFGILKVILQREGQGSVDVDARDEDGRMPLLWAAREGHEAVVKLLLATGKVDIDARDGNGRTPLLWAAREGHEAVVKQLLATGKVDTNARDDVYGWTPLLWAAEEGHEAVVKLLLATGKVDIDAGDEYGWTPLLWAAKEGHEAVVKLLLKSMK